MSLKAIINDGQSLSRNTVYLRQHVIDERDRAFVQACVYGVLRHYYSLKSLLATMLTKPLRRKDADIEALLLSALYQMRYMDVAAHAVVSANVEAARVMNKSWACALINAVLRRALTQTAPAADDESVRYEHPKWLIDRLKRDYPNDWSRLLAANNAHPPMTLRVNRLLTSPAEYLENLSVIGISASATEYSSDGIVLAQATAVERLPGFDRGWVSVQDEAAQLAADLLELDSATRVLDACAAPGGKTTHILERLSPRGEVVALDRDASRLTDIVANMTRLGLDCATFVADAAEPTRWWNGVPFDRILLDAPCSATGVIRRHPDIRFHRVADDIDSLAAEQLRLLNKLWPLVAVGGTLLYVTCSTLAAENDDVVARLVATATDIDIDVLAATWGRGTRFGRQILPGEHGMDGFYYARLRKRTPEI